MNDQNNFPLNQTEQPQKQESATLGKVPIVKFIIRTLLLLPVPLFLGASVFLVGFGCAFDISDSFECRIGIPSFKIGFLVSAIALVVISRGAFSGKTSRLAIAMFIGSLVVPLFLFTLPYMLPDDL